MPWLMAHLWQVDVFLAVVEGVVCVCPAAGGD